MLSIQSFSDEFVKIAKAMSNAQKADAHLSSETKDWSMFENLLNSKGFQKEVVKHELSDDKLKKYVQNYGAYLTAKKVVGKVPSTTSSKSYDIKQLPDGRLGCGCKDWQYRHSWAGTNCKHISLMTKTSSVASLGKAFRAVQLYNRHKDDYEEGKAAKEYMNKVTPKGRVLADVDRILTKKIFG